MKKRIISILAVVLVFCFAIAPVSTYAIFPDPFAPNDISGDGQITMLDTLMVLQAVCGLIPFTPEQAALADANKDGFFNIIDVLYYLQYATNYHIMIF